jgi:hypothetical protein
MKNRITITNIRHLSFSLAIIPSLLIRTLTATAQSQTSAASAEAEIRRLEKEQVEYLISGNVAEMNKNWDPDFIVNNPFNVVQEAATGPIQSGVLTYSRFERNIEKITNHDSVIIVMGNELVIPKTGPKGTTHATTQEIKRRFTSVWMRKNGKWLMIARHASEICSK